MLVILSRILRDLGLEIHPGICHFHGEGIVENLLVHLIGKEEEAELESIRDGKGDAHEGIESH